MQIVHLDECHSTQEYLKNQLSEGQLQSPALVYTHNQTSGRGRRNKVWHHFEGSLAFSFITQKFEPVTFSPLAIGVILCESFKELGVDLRLKWPNDLISLVDGKKVGGILSQVYDDQQILSGVGINLFPREDKKEFDYPHGFVFNKNQNFDTVQFFNLFSQKLEKRNLNFKEIWNHFCSHLDKKVFITDQSTIEGWFRGVGENGEALLESDLGELLKVFTGSLRFLSSENKS